ncbi:MAG: NAD(P)H-hydrate dehydratase [Acidobacteria bacterium]|nr:MAG: NAD(P)H-hydrate dehydratase [Acidobacteriota bacterium]
MNQAGIDIVSIDVPSGLSSDTGELLGSCVRAAITVSLAALKYCHVTAPASKMCGEIFVVDIGIPVESTTAVVRSELVRSMLPHRRPDSHKGSFGHAVVIGGSVGKSGAPYMSGKATLRAGAGLSTVITPSNVQPIVATLGPEIMTISSAGNPNYFTYEAAVDTLTFVKDKDAVAIGPGMGSDEGSLTFFQQVATAVTCALVIDADGLNLLSRNKMSIAGRKKESTILTPHPGEMSRIAQLTTAEVQKDRVGVAKRIATELQSIIVLKGYRTVIADPDGRVWINLTGGSSLASGGTGDILTGLITGYLAQGLTPREAALTGVYAHGFVANLFESEFPQQALNAMDILNYWNQAIHLIRTASDLEGDYLKIHFRV